MDIIFEDLVHHGFIYDESGSMSCSSYEVGYGYRYIVVLRTKEVYLEHQTLSWQNPDDRDFVSVNNCKTMEDLKALKRIFLGISS